MMGMTDEEIAEFQPDYIVLDEFHRCGAEMWGQDVQKLLSTYAATPVLGLSATAIRYLDNQRDMADELFDGNVASEITLGEAIVRGILAAPKYKKLNDTLTASWDPMYEKAKDYYTQNGNLEVPYKYKTADGYSLGHWILTQKRVRTGDTPGILSAERIAKLDEIGMVWDVADHIWQQYYGACLTYYHAHENLNIPAKYITADGLHLDLWLWRIKKGKIKLSTSGENGNQIKRLESIGIRWRKKPDESAKVGTNG